MPPSSSSIEEFGLNVKKEKRILKQAKNYLSKNDKNTLKEAGSQATSSIRRLFVSLDIHYKNSLNTEVWKQNKIYKQTSNKSC